MSKRALRRIERQRTELIERGVRKTLASEEGRRFLIWLFEQTNILGNAFRSDTHDTAFALGQQNIGQMLLALLERAEPEGWFRLRNEMQRMIGELREAEKEKDDEQ